MKKTVLLLTALLAGLVATHAKPSHAANIVVAQPVVESNIANTYPRQYTPKTPFQGQYASSTYQTNTLDNPDGTRSYQFVFQYYKDQQIRSATTSKLETVPVLTTDIITK